MAKKLILIADDEPNIVSLLEMILKDNYEIITALDGKEALELLEKRRPDLIILDVMMPEVNGFEICEKLKKDPKTKEIIIAMLSAKTQEKDIIQGLKLGADYYLTKPFDPSTFAEQIAEILK